MSIEVVDLTHVYLGGTARAVTAVDRVSLRIDDGEAVGIMGPTGSGKSTLVQHFNGLLRPTSGRVLVDGVDLWGAAAGGSASEDASSPAPERARRVSLRLIRRKVGLIFQFPEQQLFEETVFDDVAFGPRNLGLGEEEIRERVTEALALVGVGGDDAPAFYRRSPFGLSGGQMRRVAIAGVLAMKPATLVLDEPTAGLDPRGRKNLLETLARLNREQGLTLVVVSHNMEDLARLVDRAVVLDRGRIVRDGPARDVFTQPAWLKSLGLDAPPVACLMEAVARRGARVRTDLIHPEEAAAELSRWLESGAARWAGEGGAGRSVDA